MNPLDDHLQYLKLAVIAAQHQDLAAEAARHRWTHPEFLLRLLEPEVQARRQRALERRLQAARFPVRKTLDQYRWDWPKKINEAQVRHLFGLDFVSQKANAIFLGGVGLGKSHLATALGY